MPLPLGAIIVGGLAGFARKVFAGATIGKFFSWTKKTLAGTKNPATGKGEGGFFGRTWNKLVYIVFSLGNIGWLLSIIQETFKKILGIFGVGGAITTGTASVVQIKRLLSSINDPQAALLDYIAGAVQYLPYSFDTLIASVDSQLSSATSRFFNPPITLTYMLRVTGVGEAFNQIMMSVIQGAIFVFSVYLVRWAFSSNFTYVKTDPKPRPR